jgi:hypothetical protein
MDEKKFSINELNKTNLEFSLECPVLVMMEDRKMLVQVILKKFQLHLQQWIKEISIPSWNTRILCGNRITLMDLDRWSTVLKIMVLIFISAIDQALN